MNYFWVFVAEGKAKHDQLPIGIVEASTITEALPLAKAWYNQEFNLSEGSSVGVDVLHKAASIKEAENVVSTYR